MFSNFNLFPTSLPIHAPSSTFTTSKFNFNENRHATKSELRRFLTNRFLFTRNFKFFVLFSEFRNRCLLERTVCIRVFTACPTMPEVKTFQTAIRQNMRPKPVGSDPTAALFWRMRPRLQAEEAARTAMFWQLWAQLAASSQSLLPSKI